MVTTCLKILLIPSYRSTDFDVHRNWLAVTRQLPISEWYWNDVDGGTVHTLDYPPAFAIFEYILSNNPITDFVLPPGDRCLELLPDTDNHPSEACIMFQRSTVILGDIIFWAGSYFACRAYHYQKPRQFAVISFLLIVFNPALLWLDHMHFQYNGMMIGVMLTSLGCFCMGNNVAQFLPGKFLMLAVVTGSVLVLPWIPFVKDQNDPKEQLIQILSRLFPFGRGLVHDYWAGNIWAIYTFANRIFLAVTRRLVPILLPVVPAIARRLERMSLPEPTPLMCAVLLFLSIIPGLQMASLRLTNKKLIEAVVYVSFCAFMLAYHVHEKAILTTMIPLTLLVEPTPRSEYHNLLFWHIATWGLLGIFPLLFRPIELTVKLGSFFCFMGLTSYLLRTPPRWMQDMQNGTLGMIALVIGLLEIIPIQGKWEFFPLMVTSIACAFGLLGCWAMTFWLLIRAETR
eukprot:jgi/Psemu1/244741/estExt_Genewise1.C_4920032